MDINHLINGCWLNLYKPKGMTSNQALGKVKRILNIKKMGHGGTLDPLAEGVLPIAIGECTKVVSYLLMSDKSYVFDITFGEKRTTDDMEGEVIETSNINPCNDDIVNILSSFLGEGEQLPPVFSAIKVSGKKLCDIARKSSIDDAEKLLKKRNITIKELSFLKRVNENTVRIDVLCSKGTYVRSLARDISKSLGTVGYVSFLKRTKSGSFLEKDSISMEKLTKFHYSVEESVGFLKVRQPLDDILVLSVSSEEAERMRKGQRVFLESALNYGNELPVFIEYNGYLICIGEINNSVVAPKRVFNKNVYL